MHYHWFSVLIVLSAVLLADLAAPPASLWGDIRVKHTWNTVPVNWESLGPPPAGTTIDLYIALTPYRESALIDALYEVSDPMHEKYRAHLSKEQVAELVAPHQDTLDIVHSWVGYHGVPSSSVSTSHGGGWLTISGVPVFQADELLGASYQLYRHTGTNDTEVILRTVGYSLPAALHAHVQTVAPTTHFAPPRASLQTPRKRSSEEAAVMVNATSEEFVRAPSTRTLVTPSFLRWFYHMEAYVPAAVGAGNVLAILGFETGPSRVDLTRFMADYCKDAKDATFTVVELNGGLYDPNRILEIASLNSQYAAALTYPTPQIYYVTGGHFQWDFNEGGKPAPGDAYLSWLRYLLDGQSVPPTVIISSAIPESVFPREYAWALCILFAQLGVRGVTVLVTSGDDGIGRGDCKDRSGNVQFIPMFPASCPWVTSVGGTKGRDENLDDVAADFSGGGFSNYFLLPEYQTSAVHAYLRLLGAKYAGSYQIEARGIPDIAAQADNFAYIYEDDVKYASSTSCSTSVVAAIVSLLNDYLISNGWTTIGFLNLLLYSHGFEGVLDVTHGSNPGCGSDGFHATEGWDPVTGMGLPNFYRLMEILKRLAPPTRS